MVPSFYHQVQVLPASNPFNQLWKPGKIGVRPQIFWIIFSVFWSETTWTDSRIDLLKRSPCLFPPKTSDVDIQKTENFLEDISSKDLKPYMIQEHGPLKTSNTKAKKSPKNRNIFKKDCLYTMMVEVFRRFLVCMFFCHENATYWTWGF